MTWGRVGPRECFSFHMSFRNENPPTVRSYSLFQSWWHWLYTSSQWHGHSLWILHKDFHDLPRSNLIGWFYETSGCRMGKTNHWICQVGGIKSLEDSWYSRCPQAKLYFALFFVIYDSYVIEKSRYLHEILSKSVRLTVTHLHLILTVNR